MRCLTMFFLGAFLFLSTMAMAQEHGIIAGTSFSWFHKKGYYPLEVDKGKFNYVFGYQYRLPIKNRFSADFGLLFGNQKVDLSPTFSANGSPMDVITTLNPKYFALDLVANYALFTNLRLGAGISPSLYFDWGGTEKNTKKHPMDIPIVGKVSYSFKYFDIQLAYRHGLFNLFENDKIDSMKSRSFQLSLFIPLMKRN